MKITIDDIDIRVVVSDDEELVVNTLNFNEFSGGIYGYFDFVHNGSISELKGFVNKEADLFVVVREDNKSVISISEKIILNSYNLSLNIKDKSFKATFMFTSLEEDGNEE